MKNLTVSEALIALGNGEKITSDWMLKTGALYIYENDIGEAFSDDAEALITARILRKILQADNLKIYKEPKKMIKVAKYARKNSYGKWEDCLGEFYKDEGECRFTNGGKHFYRRLDYTEIEVEDC